MSIKTEFAVSMTCESCVQDIKAALKHESDIERIDIDLQNQSVVVEGKAPPSRLTRLLKETGRTVIVRGMGVANGQHVGAAVCIFESYTPLGASGPLTQNRADEQPRGLARLVQITDDLCLIDVTVQGLTPGEHALAVHSCGDISRGAASCGDHYDPTGTATHGPPDHGAPRDEAPEAHAGDLGNIVVDKQGWGDVVLETRRFRIADVIGRSMVVAHGADDLGRGNAATSLKDGGAGQGALCGVIARSAGVFANTKRVCACDGRTLWEEARLQEPRL
ncbi:superoxide dismutase [Syncephalis pseudoplumigaleata]|uniref:Superoxide dismutase 1 copper chaperone n=1 Tax=Syncephalis pseudoplumigaleata TaxID=1712513 RepID=A0A4P9YYP7_9FUNG|nr:superoxide dismutase [Syncephalis pseudoplumigaleata]|eukprot:RKP25098.1 superoxide dismutase [Syncephalis pseudoplumigaleata]